MFGFGVFPSKSGTRIDVAECLYGCLAIVAVNVYIHVCRQSLVGRRNGRSHKRKVGRHNATLRRCDIQIGDSTGNACRSDVCYIYIIYIYAVHVRLTICIKAKTIVAVSLDKLLQCLCSGIRFCYIIIIGKHCRERSGIGGCAEKYLQVLWHRIYSEIKLQFINSSGRKMELRRDAPVVTRQAGLIVQHIGRRTVEIFPCASSIVINKRPAGKIFLGIEGLSKYHITAVGTGTDCSHSQ